MQWTAKKNSGMPAWFIQSGQITLWQGLSLSACKPVERILPVADMFGDYCCVFVWSRNTLVSCNKINSEHVARLPFAAASCLSCLDTSSSGCLQTATISDYHPVLNCCSYSMSGGNTDRLSRHSITWQFRLSSIFSTHVSLDKSSLSRVAPLA